MFIEPWVWAILLLMLGMGLAILEVFFPSGGILGILSACAIVGAIYFGFRQQSLVGFGVLAAAMVGLPVIVVLAFKYWPNTRIGRKMLLMDPVDVLPDDPQMEHLRSLVGQVGQTKCKMLPAGAIVIDGRTVDAVSEGMPIEAGRSVRILEVKTTRVVVRPLDDEEPSPTADDPMQRPIDSVIPDPYEDGTS